MELAQQALSSWMIITITALMICELHCQPSVTPVCIKLAADDGVGLSQQLHVTYVHPSLTITTQTLFIFSSLYLQGTPEQSVRFQI